MPCEKKLRGSWEKSSDRDASLMASEGGKEGRRWSRLRCSLRRLGKAPRRPSSQSHLVEESCVSQEWVCLSICGTFNHQLRATHEKCGLSTKAGMDFRAQQLGIWVTCASHNWRFVRSYCSEAVEAMRIRGTKSPEKEEY